MKKVPIFLFLLTLNFSVNAQDSCSSVSECEEMTEVLQEQLERLEEVERIEALIERDVTQVSSLRVPYMRPFAKDRDGNHLLMTYPEARTYCHKRGLRLPSALEFMLVSRLGGVEISFLDKNKAGYTEDGRAFAHAFGYEVPGWSARYIKSYVNSVPNIPASTKFYYHRPSNFYQRISAYTGATFWSSTLFNDHNLYVYHGDSGALIFASYYKIPRSVRMKNSDGSYRRNQDGSYMTRIERSYAKHAVVCAESRN